MKILIAGGAGFIGSALVLALQGRHQIVCLDHGRKYPQLKRLVGDRVSLVEGEISDSALLDRLMPGTQAVIHLGGGGGNARCLQDPAWAVRTHTLGTHLLLQKALQHRAARFFFASSVSAYTTYRKRELPLREEMALEPDDLYGALKAAAEQEIRDSGLDYLILRLANVYGYGSGLQGLEMGGAINNFIAAGRDGSDITLFGTGQQGMDYLHIDDLCRCLVALVENPSLRREVFNAGSGSLHSLQDIAATVVEVARTLYGRPVAIKRAPAPEGKVWPDRLMSIEKVQRRLGWAPSVSLRAGIEEMMTRLGG